MADKSKKLPRPDHIPDPKQGNHGMNDPTYAGKPMKDILKKIEKGEIKIKKK